MPTKMRLPSGRTRPTISPFPSERPVWVSVPSIRPLIEIVQAKVPLTSPSTDHVPDQLPGNGFAGGSAWTGAPTTPSAAIAMNPASVHRVIVRLLRCRCNVSQVGRDLRGRSRAKTIAQDFLVDFARTGPENRR